MGAKRRADEGIGPYRVRRRNRRNGRTKSSAPTIASVVADANIGPHRTSCTLSVGGGVPDAPFYRTSCHP